MAKFKVGDKIKCIDPTGYKGGYKGMVGTIMPSRHGSAGWLDVKIPGIKGVSYPRSGDPEMRGVEENGTNWEIVGSSRNCEEILTEFLTKQEESNADIEESSQDDCSNTRKESR